MRQQEQPVARSTDGQGEAGAIEFDAWDRSGTRVRMAVFCDKDAIVSIRRGAISDDAGRTLLELDEGSVSNLVDALRAKAAEATRMTTDRLPRKVFDDAHRFDKGGGPSW
jgi:hypothetical protein